MEDTSWNVCSWSWRVRCFALITPLVFGGETEIQSEPRVDRVVYLLRYHSQFRSEYSDEEILAFLESIDYPFRIFVEYVDNYSKFVRNHEVISQLYFLLLLND